MFHLRSDPVTRMNAGNVARRPHSERERQSAQAANCPLGSGLQRKRKVAERKAIAEFDDAVRALRKNLPHRLGRAHIQRASIEDVANFEGRRGGGKNRPIGVGEKPDPVPPPCPAQGRTRLHGQI